MKKATLPVVAAVAALALTAGYLLMRNRGSGPPARTGARPSISPPLPAGTTGAHPLLSSKNPREDHVAPAHPRSSGPRTAPATTAEFLAILRAFPENHESHEQMDELSRRMEEFQALLEADPGQRRLALEAFGREENRPLMDILTAVLGQVDRPDVREAMIRVVQTDPSPHRRGQALAVLGGHESREAIPVALQVLRTEAEPDLLAKAVEALPDRPPEGTTNAERAEVVEELSRLTRAASPDLRGPAYAALGDWTDESTTPTLLEGLRDPEVPVRAGAAYALARRAEHSPAAKEALLKLLQDPNEHIDVRGTAADSLGTFSENDPEIRRAVTAFQEWEAKNPTPAGDPK